MTNKKNKKNKKNKTGKKKQRIPKAIREQVWIQNFGEKFKHKCYISWCKNNVNVFDFHVGHNKPESKGGSLALSNLKPICARCNLSMSNNYTITQWQKLNKKKTNCCCFFLFG
tara:strand:- start:219 stop:557 length:339 start_codon:yes stop_codon:yes gene_type:complete